MPKENPVPKTFEELLERTRKTPSDGVILVKEFPSQVAALIETVEQFIQLASENTACVARNLIVNLQATEEGIAQMGRIQDLFFKDEKDEKALELLIIRNPQIAGILFHLCPGMELSEDVSEDWKEDRGSAAGNISSAEDRRENRVGRHALFSTCQGLSRARAYWWRKEEKWGWHSASEKKGSRR